MADDEIQEPATELPRRRARKPVLRASSVEDAPSIDATEVHQGNDSLRRKIPGNIPYMFGPGVLKRVLEKIPEAEKPTIFGTDFLGTVLGATGGTARPIIPILKTTQMLNQGGAPTELYAQFQTEGGRATAALQALRNGFAEVFRRNSYAHNATDAQLTDILVAITGLPRNDRILRSMLSTFQCFQDYAKLAKGEAFVAEVTPEKGQIKEETPTLERNSKPLQLVYNINVVLPETTNVEVFNAIFKSLRSNLLN